MAKVGLAGLGLAILAIGCGGDQRERRERTAELAACIDGVERAATAAPGVQVEAVARACPAACDGLAGWLMARATTRPRPGSEADAAGPAPLEALIAGCEPRCLAAFDGSAGVPPWPELVGACGADALGVPRDQPHLASEPWLALTEVARWIERTLRAGVTDPEVPARAEHVTTASVFVLPAPAPPGVPRTRFRAASRARQLVVVGDELRIGAPPHVRLRGGRLEILVVPGAHPGQLVELDRLRAAFLEHAELLAAHGGPVAEQPGPLVIADAAVPLARVIDVLARLEVGRAELAVAGDVALAHPVALERRDKAVAAPEIRLEPTGLVIRGFGDDRVTDWEHLDAELDHFAAVNAPVRSVELIPHPGTTVADLARLLDACVAARISSVIFAPSDRGALHRRSQ